MKRFILALSVLFSTSIWAQNLVKDCSISKLSTNSFAVDCDLAKVQIFETQKLREELTLGRANYTVLFRFVVKNPQNFSRLVLEKPVAGAVEECIVQTMYDLGSVALVLQSPLPHSGGRMLIGKMEACMKTILSEQLLEEIIEEFDLWIRKDGWTNLRQVR